MGNIKGLKRQKAGRDYLGKRYYVDADTGELIGTDNIYKEKSVKVNFIMMFLDEVNMYEVLSGLGSSGKVLGFILKEYNDKDNMFYFSTSNKERMTSVLNLSIGTVRSCVKDLAESDVLCRVRGAEYMLNPKVFFKGGLDKRDAAIMLYDEHKRSNEIKTARKVNGTDIS